MSSIGKTRLQPRSLINASGEVEISPMVRITVDCHTLNRNANTGSNDPPFSIQRSGHPMVAAYEIGLKGSARLVYRPKTPLSGRIWIEADDVEVVT
jgi:hypothetical protein